MIPEQKPVSLPGCLAAALFVGEFGGGVIFAVITNNYFFQLRRMEPVS